MVTGTSGRATRVDDFSPLPLEDANPIGDGLVAELSPCRREQIADLRVTQEEQTGGEELTTRLANPRILEAAGPRPGEVADTWRAFAPDTSAGPIVQIHCAVVERGGLPEGDAKILDDEPWGCAR